MKLRDIDEQILRELQWATRDGKWVTPLDIGGSNGSPHSYALGKLCKMGLAEREQRSALSTIRGSWRYRAILTEDERKAIQDRKNEMDRKWAEKRATTREETTTEHD